MRQLLWAVRFLWALCRGIATISYSYTLKADRRPLGYCASAVSIDKEQCPQVYSPALQNATRDLKQTADEQTPAPSLKSRKEETWQALQRFRGCLLFYHVISTLQKQKLE